jgi:glycosyltransferase involved in cell wall biosynthesis
MAKKKILLLSDDLRLTSGIATVSRDIVLNTIDTFDWVQLGAAINHPDNGKIFDLSDDARNITGVKDASSKLYAHNGYGDPITLRKIMEMEKPDAILHFTDPRFWGWLYNMEHEIRSKIPLLYLNIWDGAGLVGDSATDPMWNKEAYASCDLLMAISKQTYGINNRIFNRIDEDTSNGRITYVPHGINTNIFHPINENETEKHNQWKELQEESKRIRGNNPDKFIVMWNNRNIHRKHPGDVVLAYKHMCQLIDKNGGNAAEDCALFMHTQPIDPNGTDLVAVVGELCNEYPVLFDDRVVPSEKLNVLYNVADVVVNMASNEGFGLATAEAITAGTPIVVNVTGGLQDQCGFINPETNEYFTADDYIKVHTLHRKDEWGHIKHGEWVKPVWPSNISLQGSVPTPYIFDDRADFREVGQALYEWYKTSKEERKNAGLKGREYVMNESIGMTSANMGKRVSKDITNCLENFKPRDKYRLYKV